MARILILEDDPIRIAEFVQGLLGHDLTIVNRAVTASNLLRTELFDVVFLDNDLGGTQELELRDADENCGYQTALTAAQVLGPDVEVVVHSLNPGAAQAMMDVLTKADISAHRRPWGSFEVRNLIRGG